MRTAPACDQKMSKESSAASQSKLIPASEVKEITTPVSHPIGLTELTASLEVLNTEVDKKSTVVHCTQTSSSSGANKIPGSPDMRDQKKTSPTPIHRPRRYALEMWLDVEVGPGLFVPPEDDSYSVNFTMEVINRAYPGCTGMYLDRASHMLAFYGQKGSMRAGLIQDVAIEASQAVGELPMWMGYTAQWRVRCVSLAEANEILAGCKRLEKENRRRERLQFQKWLASMHQFSNLSANAIPFQQAALPIPRLAGVARGLPEQERDGAPSDFSPPRRTSGSPLNRLSSPMHYPHPQSSDNGGLTTDGSAAEFTSYKKRRRSRGSKGSRGSKSDGSTSDSNRSASSNGGRKKKDGFSSKIHIPEFGGKKGHSSDVTEAFQQWARCITYYRDYYEDSYLMPLVVSSLTGDASDVFDWILSLNPGNTQDLTTLLQMLREHYCGSLTFREQRNTIENLHQRPQEAAIDFLIRVGTSVSNLGKDWKDELTEKELQSLQCEVSLNGVQEEIRHVLDSEVAKNGGKLTPQQMYEAIKKYEMYMARNRRPVHPPVNRRPLATPWVTGLGSIKQWLLLPRWLNLRMTAIISKSPLLMKERTPLELSHLRKTMRGYSFPATWRRLYPMTPPCR